MGRDSIETILPFDTNTYGNADDNGRHQRNLTQNYSNGSFSRSKTETKETKGNHHFVHIHKLRALMREGLDVLFALFHANSHLAKKELIYCTLALYNQTAQ